MDITTGVLSGSPGKKIVNETKNQNFSKVGTGINSFDSTTPLRRLEQFFGPYKKWGEVKWFPL
jgi:hypothetical protein